MNILVVDDQVEVREMLHDMLKEEGHNVHVAENGKRALDYLIVYKIDLIITDIVMPEIEGIELVLRLRQSNIPIISISGLPKETIISEFIASLGIIGFLEKPFKKNDIMPLVDNVNKSIKKKR